MGIGRSLSNGLELWNEKEHRRTLRVVDLGLADYGSVYRQQREWVDHRKCGQIADTLILVEHPEVYTYGRRSKEPLLPVGIPAYSVERGGEITYHNPGQLVAYPILALGQKERDLHGYLRRLEETLIAVLSDFRVAGERRPGATGVWLIGKSKKIASIGVAVSGWVTYHGVALNVRNDLSGFQRVQPCGFPGEVMTSLLSELGEGACPSVAAVKDRLVRNFTDHFERFRE